MKPVKVAVVGVGYFGSRHAATWKSLPQAQVVALCDVRQERAAEAAQKLGALVVTDYRALPAEVEAVSIAVPTRNHFRVARDLLLAGKHVLVEKPITANLNEADELDRVARQQGLVLQVGHLERFNPGVMALHDILDRPRFIECRRISPFQDRGTDVNVVLDLMIHDLDLVLSIVRSPLDQIEAIGVPVLSEAEDIANARLRFADGCTVNITASRVSWKKERTMRIFQPDAYILLDLIEGKLAITRKQLDATAAGLPLLTHEEEKFTTGENLKREFESFIDCVRHKRQPLVTAADARRALAAALIITEQLRSWRDRLGIEPAPLHEAPIRAGRA
ncbi:MAG TPA: Gfo/Idh/MocA family oxidoreductase [Kiloniellales bacterium]|nr:Gfo/Idh/MocA family oxidoreductase [Kiloniellales bacterium]